MPRKRVPIRARGVSPGDILVPVRRGVFQKNDRKIRVSCRGSRFPVCSYKETSIVKYLNSNSKYWPAVRLRHSSRARRGRSEPTQWIPIFDAGFSITHERTGDFRVTRRMTPAPTPKRKTTPHQPSMDAMRVMRTNSSNSGLPANAAAKLKPPNIRRPPPIIGSSGQNRFMMFFQSATLVHFPITRSPPAHFQQTPCRKSLFPSGVKVFHFILFFCTGFSRRVVS